MLTEPPPAPSFAKVLLRRGIRRAVNRLPFDLWLIPNGTDRARTDDLLRVKQALFQLSYDPVALDSLVYHCGFFIHVRNAHASGYLKAITGADVTTLLF